MCVDDELDFLEMYERLYVAVKSGIHDQNYDV